MIDMLLRVRFAILFTVAVSAFSGAVPVEQVDAANPAVPSTTIVTGSRGRIRLSLDTPPAPSIPKKSILDPERLTPDILVKYETTPPVQSHIVVWGDAFHLPESIQYLTGIPAGKIPPTMPRLCEWLPSQGYRLIRLKKLQAKATQALIANGIYVLIKALVRRDSTPLAPHFNVIKGYVTRKGPRKGVASLPGEKSMVLCLMDNKAFHIKERQYLRWHDRSLALTLSNSYSNFGGLYKTSIYIEDVFTLVPDSFQSADVNRYVNTTMEQVSLFFKSPEIEEIKPY